MVKFPRRNKIWVVLKPLYIYIYIYIYCPKATFTHRGRLSVWITKKLGLVRFWLVATFFELLLLISYHQKFMAIYNNISFLLSASLISCVPYHCSQTFLSVSDESSQALDAPHVCIWWEPWPCYDPNFPAFDNLKESFLLLLDEPLPPLLAATIVVELFPIDCIELLITKLLHFVFLQNGFVLC